MYIYLLICIHIYLGKYDCCTFVRFEHENIYTDLTGPPADETNLNDFIVFLVMICWGRFHNGFRFVFNMFLFVCMFVGG